MEIYDQQSHMLLANVSSKVPIFTVNGLDAGLLLKIVIYATNMRGRSEPILLQAYTLKAAEKQTGKRDNRAPAALLFHRHRNTH